MPSAKSSVRLRTFVETLHPDDRERIVEVWRRSFENALPYSTEMRTLRPDGSVGWIHGRGKAYYSRAGKSLYMIGVCFDVTERRRAEQERDELSGRLINAQEQERKHLARELHDDFGQRLAFLSVELARVADMAEEAPADASTRTRQLQSVLAELGSDLHAVSHRLHSSSLEILGLVSAVASLCGEVSSQYDVEVEFHHKSVPENISSDAALSLFRIVQEGLRNVIKHSRASTVQVWLEGSDERIFLRISDNGVGFDALSGHRSRGIGIQSMSERARILGGKLEINSQPNHGTDIVVTATIKTSCAAA